VPVLIGGMEQSIDFISSEKFRWTALHRKYGQRASQKAYERYQTVQQISVIARAARHRVSVPSPGPKPSPRATHASRFSRGRSAPGARAELAP
jgi:hypothetical protein